MKHWAIDVMDKPWRENATGPDAFNCRGLTDWACRVRFNEPLPSPETVHASAWRRVDGPPAEDDVVLMQGPNGKHIGFMVKANGRLGVLHCDGYQSKYGPVGGVRFQSIADATSGGYHQFEFWRRNG